MQEYLIKQNILRKCDTPYHPMREVYLCKTVKIVLNFLHLLYNYIINNVVYTLTLSYLPCL